jgi:hypothetical protein
MLIKGPFVSQPGRLFNVAVLLRHDDFPPNLFFQELEPFSKIGFWAIRHYNFLGFRCRVSGVRCQDKEPDDVKDYQNSHSAIFSDT